MEISYVENGKPRLERLDDAVTERLQRVDYDHGELERIRAVAQQHAEAFGRLIDLLAERQVITHGEALGFTGYDAHFDQATIHP